MPVNDLNEKRSAWGDINAIRLVLEDGIALGLYSRKEILLGNYI